MKVSSISKNSNIKKTRDMVLNTPAYKNYTCIQKSLNVYASTYAVYVHFSPIKFFQVLIVVDKAYFYGIGKKFISGNIIHFSSEGKIF